MTAPTYSQGIAPGPGAPLLGNVDFIPPGFEGCFKVPFTYNVVFPDIGVQTLTESTNINNDSYFVCCTQTATIWDQATQSTTQIDPGAFPAFVTILDTSSGRNLMSGPTPFANYFGTAQRPFVWLYRAQVYRPGGQITIQLQNLYATADVTVYCSFTGFKVYPNVPDEGSAF